MRVPIRRRSGLCILYSNVLVYTSADSTLTGASERGTRTTNGAASARVRQSCAASLLSQRLECRIGRPTACLSPGVICHAGRYCPRGGKIVSKMASPSKANDHTVHPHILPSTYTSKATVLQQQTTVRTARTNRSLSAPTRFISCHLEHSHSA